MNDGSGYLRNVRCATDTEHHDATLPYVATGDAANVTSHSMTLRGEIHSEGKEAVTERGFVWSLNNNPNKDSGNIVTVDITEAGAVGSYSSELKGLEANTNYYIRAFAVSPLGTTYGKTIRVKTKNKGTSEDVGRDDDFEW